MKTRIGVGLVIVLLGVGIAWQESQRRSLAAQLVELEKQAAIDDGKPDRSGKPGRLTSSTPASRANSKPDRPLSDSPGDEAGKEDQEKMAENIRKIFENPAGRAVIAEENKVKAAHLYGKLIDGFDLTEEEEEFFIELLAPSLGEDDALGMKMFSATSDEEREQLLTDYEKAQEERRDAIETFLNNGEDFETYENYHARRSEYKQLPSIKTVFQETGAPLTPAQETALVEAMYEARTESGLTERWEGRAGFEQYAEPGVSNRFREDWTDMQNTLSGKTGEFLDETQQDAFSGHQDQMRDFALMGISWVEKMVHGN